LGNILPGIGQAAHCPMCGCQSRLDLTGLFWRRFEAMMSDQRIQTLQQHGECTARVHGLAGARGMDVAVCKVFLVCTIPNKQRRGYDA
jgi:hypothetical protein